MKPLCINNHDVSVCGRDRWRQCRECARQDNWVRYGIRLTTQEYAGLFKKQEGKCAICFKVYKRLVVDHDHKTGIVRGLLCGDHNKALGKVNDSVDELQSLIDYLKGERKPCHSHAS